MRSLTPDSRAPSPRPPIDTSPHRARVCQSNSHQKTIKGPSSTIASGTTNAKDSALNLEEIEKQFSSNIAVLRAVSAGKEQSDGRIRALEAEVQALRSEVQAREEEARHWKTRWQTTERERLGASGSCTSRPSQSMFPKTGERPKTERIFESAGKSQRSAMLAPGDASLPPLGPSSGGLYSDPFAPIAPPSLYITEASVLSDRVDQLKEMLSRVLKEKNEMADQCRKFKLLANCRNGSATQMQLKVEEIQNKLKQSQRVCTVLEAENEELKQYQQILYQQLLESRRKPKPGR